MAFDYHHIGGSEFIGELRSTVDFALRVRPERRRQAVLFERDRRGIEVIGERVCNRLAAQMNAKILTAFERGENIIPVLREKLQWEFTPLIQKAMVAGHLQGRLRSARTTAARLQESRRTMSVYDDALKFLEQRLALSPEQMQSLMDKYGVEAANVTREFSVGTEVAVQKAMQKIVERGEHVREAVATLRDALHASGSGPMSSAVMNTLVRTQVQMSYSAGRWNANQDEAIQEILHSYEYSTVGDDRVRPSHAAMDGVRAAKDDPIWKTWWPPSGFNCRCTTLEIFVGDREAELRPPPDRFVASDGTIITNPQPDEGWRWNPGTAFETPCRGSVKSGRPGGLMPPTASPSRSQQLRA